MVLTIKAIRAAGNDEELFEKLTAELTRRLPAELHDDLSRLVEEMQSLPPGLRAMAATFKLDVSMALDDLGWHFANFHHRGYCNETSRGLWELEAEEIAQIFDKAYKVVLPYWDQISDMLAVDFNLFSEWYNESDLYKALSPLNCRLWDIWEEASEFGFMRFWMVHARKYPERCVDS
jgi:hypothetical protein